MQILNRNQFLSKYLFIIFLVTVLNWLEVAFVIHYLSLSQSILSGDVLVCSRKSLNTFAKFYFYTNNRLKTCEITVKAKK